MARVELRELVKRGKKHLETSRNVAIDATDEDACVDLLKRMAKKHGVDAGACEISVKSGTRAKTYRI
jgi:hypothetical protein